MHQEDCPSFVPNVRISFMMKKADFMYPEWLSNNTAFPFQQQTTLSFVCPAPFRPGRKVSKPRFLYSSSSTATTSFPGPDQPYGNESMSKPTHSDDLGVSEISGYERDRQRLRDLEVGNKRPPSRSKRGSYALVEKGFDREECQVMNNSLPAKPPTFRSNGIRSSLVRGEQLLNQRNTASNSGHDSDELIAMGTLWSPANNNNANNASGGGSSGPTTRSSSTTTASNKSYQNNGSNGGAVRKSISVNVNAMSRLNHNSNFSGTTNGTLGKVSSNNNKEVEPKYPDPLSGAPASFQQRLMELASLEAETIRWERTKKVKKKPKQDRDS